MERLLDLVHVFAIEEIWRLGLTASVFALVPLSLKFSRVHLARTWAGATMSQRRERQVVSRNAIMLAAVLVLGAVWGSKIAGFALSLAAVAGALLIVSKEALLNILGFVSITVTKPFALGDYVEIATSRGRVVDVNAMATTLLEAREGHQVTGAIVSVPNALVLTHPVRNLTTTGDFVVNLLQVRLPRDADVFAHEKALIDAANAVCSPWQALADAHLDRLERDRNYDLPSAETRVLIEMRESRHADFTLRYACRPNDRVKVEQAILRQYLARAARLHTATAGPECAAEA